MGKTIIAPLVALIFMILQNLFGLNVGTEVQNQIVELIVNIVALGTILYGIIKNHRKPKSV